MDILTSLNKNGSGLNIRDLASSLVTAEIQPRKQAIERRVTATEASISALGTLRASLDKMNTALTAVSTTPILTAKTTGSSLSITPTAKNLLTEGTTQLNVVSLATRQVLEFTGFNSPAATVGAGTIQVEFGAWIDTATNDFEPDPSRTAQTLTFAAGATLQEVADAMSEIEGVTARVVDKGDGTYSLGVVSEFGVTNNLRFSVTEDAANPGLSALDTRTSIATKQIQGASDALIQVDGLSVFRPTNSITDLVPGAQIDLGSTGITTITIARDREIAADNMTFLVDSINETLTQLSALTSRGLNGGTRGALAGDLAADGLQGRIQSLMARTFSGYGRDGVSLAELGVATERNGTLRFDRATFDAAFTADPLKFEAAFNNSLTTRTPGIAITGAPTGAPAAGAYDFSRPGGIGPATIGGSIAFGIGLGDGTSRFVPLGGPLAGTVITATDGIESAQIDYGVSLTSLLQTEIQNMLSSQGSLAKRETQLNETLFTQQEQLDALDIKAETSETRYLQKFTAMEIVISQLNSTGSYITNLIDAWNRDT